MLSVKLFTRSYSDVCEAIHIYRMKTLSCIEDAQLALGAQDTPEERKECVTYPCYPRPNKHLLC